MSIFNNFGSGKAQITPSDATLVNSGNAFINNLVSPQAKTNLSLISNMKLGSFAKNKGWLGRDGAAILDASLDYFLNDTKTHLPSLSENLKSLKDAAGTKNFIPIILQTEFKYDILGQQTPVPLYILFDSTPEQIVESKTANWNSTSFLGRSNPVWTYKDSSPITMTLNGTFYVDSRQEHKFKLKLADYLISLATPNKKNFMPSPIRVYIGEWKRFRAIVTNVSITYKGPWAVTDKQAIKNLASNYSDYATSRLNRDTSTDGYYSAGTATAVTYANAQADKLNTYADTIIDSHSPYIFDASISLTIIPDSDYEDVYAEDIVSGVKKTMALDSNQVNSQYSLISSENRETAVSTLYNSSSVAVKYTIDNGIVKQTISGELTQNSNINIADNSARKAADSGIITSVISNRLASSLSNRVGSLSKLTGFRG